MVYVTLNSNKIYLIFGGVNSFLMIMSVYAFILTNLPQIYAYTYGLHGDVSIISLSLWNKIDPVCKINTNLKPTHS